MEPPVPIKKLNQIMKRFLDTKKDSEPYLSHYKTNGADYFASNKGSACNIMFKEKYYRKESDIEFRKPGTGETYESTNEVENYPDIESVFNLDLSSFHEIKLPVDDIPDWIAVHDTFSKGKRLGGNYFCTMMSVTTDYINLETYDNPLEVSWDYWVSSDGTEDFVIELFYDHELMANILKSLKDLKPTKINIYVDKDKPIYIIASDIDFEYKFALAQKLVR